MLDAFAEAHSTDEASMSQYPLRSTSERPESLPLWMQDSTDDLPKDLPNYIPVNFDCLTDVEESRAWFLSMAARIGIGPCRYIIKQLWATVPDTQVQSFGIILLYNMSVRLYNHDDFDFIKRMISSGLDLNRPQHWKSRRRLHDTYP